MSSALYWKREAEKKARDARLCQCGHTYLDHAGYGGPCLGCHGKCEGFKERKDAAVRGVSD